MKLPITDILYDSAKAAEVPPEIIASLRDSIKEKGLIHEILVRKSPNGYQVLVGLKRLLAVTSLGEKEIEARIVEASTDDEATEISLHENLKRANLEWWQQAKLVEEYHNLQVKKHDKRSTRVSGRGVSAEGRPKKGEETWGLRETAEALGMSLGNVSENINLARAVEASPSLRNVKDRVTAIKLVRAESRRIIAEDEAGGDDTFLKGVPRDDLLFGDSSALLKHIPGGSFDACITDPPWLRFHERGKLEKDEFTDRVFPEVFRVLRVNTFLYAFVGVDDWFYYRDFLPRFGFTVSKTPLIWAKDGAMSPVGVSSWEYNRDFELILLAVKGTPSLTKRINQSGVLRHKIVAPRLMIHPHEKPLSLIQHIIEDCTFEGMSILDPFAGSGAVLEAAKNMKRSWLGIERDRDFYVNGRKRLGLDG